MAEKGHAVGDAIYKEICGKCGAKRVDRQLGLEPTFQEYINKLCDIFDEVKRVLKKEGTCWVNIGDTYSRGQRKKDGVNHSLTKNKEVHIEPKLNPDYRISDKCLIQIPSRFAIEMTNRGWILRNEIIWYKPNCMPSSADDRFTVDFEKIFFFVKNKKYYFEQQTEPMAEVSINRAKKFIENNEQYNPEIHKTDKNNKAQSSMDVLSRYAIMDMSKGRNKRTVWKIPPKGYKDAHFAIFPKELVVTPIKAGCPPKGIVLDIFMGSGTTAEVARYLSRIYVGIELNPEYIKLCNKRLKQDTLL